MEKKVIHAYMTIQCKTLIQFCGVSEYLKHVVTLGSHYEPVRKNHTCDKITIICHSDFPEPVTVQSCDGKMLSPPHP